MSAQRLQWGLSEEAWSPGLGHFPAVDVAPRCFDLFSNFSGDAFRHLGVPQPSLAKILSQEYSSSVADGGGGALTLSAGLSLLEPT